MYEMWSYYNAQHARALFLQSQVQAKLEDFDAAEASQERATDMYEDITQKSPRGRRDLELNDFDAIVPVWAR